MILAFLFLALAIYGFAKMVSQPAKPKKVVNNNPYVQIHSKKLENDRNYENYLQWCAQNNEIPMDKKVFLKDVESKENEIKNLLE